MAMFAVDRGKRAGESKKQLQIHRLTTPRLKKTPGAPFAQDDSLSV